MAMYPKSKSRLLPENQRSPSMSTSNNGVRYGLAVMIDWDSNALQVFAE
jgi:hypothetical protein